MVASIVTYPHEVVRTRLQTQKRLLDPTAPRKPTGIVRTVRKIVTYEGWRGLYKGLSINLLRTVPNSAVTMLTYVQSLVGWPFLTDSGRYELLMRHLARIRT
jgi:solute carrier family 25 folate transporter 32